MIEALLLLLAGLGLETLPPEPRELPPGRRAAVVVLSLAFFLGVALYAARRLKSAMRGGPGQLPPSH